MSRYVCTSIMVNGRHSVLRLFWVLLSAISASSIAEAQTVTINVEVVDLKGGLLHSTGQTPSGRLRSREQQDVEVFAHVFTNISGARRDALSVASFQDTGGKQATLTSFGVGTVAVDVSSVSATNESFVVLQFRRAGSGVVTAISPFIAIPRDNTGRPLNVTNTLVVAVPEPTVAPCVVQSECWSACPYRCRLRCR